MGEPFAKVPARVASCNLGGRALRVLIAIASHADREGRAYPSLGRIAALTGIDRRNLPALIAELNAAGLVRKDARKGDRGVWSTTVYRIASDAEGVSSSMMTGGVIAGDDRGCHRRRRKGVIAGNDLNRPKNRPHKEGAENAGPFSEFWRTYPHRGEHPDPEKPARLKFEAALKYGVDPAVIIRGAENYAAYVAAHGIDPRYVKHAVTWLNQELWADHQQAPEPPRLRFGMN
jgi:hypothetical protein